MRLSRLLLLGCLALLPVGAEGTHYYLRNREVLGKVVGGDVYVARDQLSKLLNPEELKRLQFDDRGQASIEGQKGPEGPGISLSWMATALGFTRRTSPGTVDWVKIQSDTTPLATSPEVWTRRAEYREARRRLNEILKEVPRTDRPELQARVERIGNQVIQATPLKDMPWTFVVVKMSAPNAACTGEGHVFVTDSLLDMNITDDELAGVLGHEVAHGVRRHVFRRSDLLRDILALLNDYRRIQGQIDQGNDSLTLRQQAAAYTRQRDQLQYKFDHDIYYTKLDEEEADVLGLRYAVSAGFSADGLGDCLSKLEKLLVKQFGAAILRDDMSHPPTARRLEILQKARRNAGF
ncbi:MAG: M48 family metalloprotease [Candidatus Eremiobacteraeota bacterium]|nr:M48 family metalloprotease [Candidatus Eremiobacteraeota bacterium]MCW5866438.1 M48 family metalloprotease [Candidatus Eremiobacteraeota bacterium]